MAPLTVKRSTSLPTVISLSKLFAVVPALLSSSHVKRDAQWITGVEEEEPDIESPRYMGLLIFSVFLVLLGGVFAGLTLALMGSDDLNLRVLATSSTDPKVRSNANKVLRLLKKGRHWVLVVLLLSNVIVNESLPIFLDAVLGGGVRAVIVSTIMIVIFGEVIPQAVCVRYGLAIGGACAPLVHAMMVIFAPVAWPIAKLLDYILGHDEGHTYKKAELKSFLQFHRYGEEPLRDDEIIILNGVLSLNDRRVKEIMTPMKDCLILSSDRILDHAAIDEILISGFSRIPIHEPGQPDNFIGMLLVKRLIRYNPEDEFPVSKFPLNALPEAKPDLNCFQALDYFQTGRAHLLLVSETPGRRGGALGVLSLEDLIEEIIGEEIIDETDRYQDNHSGRKAQRKATGEIMRAWRPTVSSGHCGIIERQRVINALSRRPSGNGPSASRTQSPAPVSREPREGLLVQIADGPYTQEPSSDAPPRYTHVPGGTASQVLGPIDEDLPSTTSVAVSVVTTAPNGLQQTQVVGSFPGSEGKVVEPVAGDPKDGSSPLAKPVELSEEGGQKDTHEAIHEGEPSGSTITADDAVGNAADDAAGIATDDAVDATADVAAETNSLSSKATDATDATGATEATVTDPQPSESAPSTSANVTKRGKKKNKNKKK